MSDYFQGNFPLQSVSEIKNTLGGLRDQTKEVSDNLAVTVAAAASDRKADDILVLKVGDVSYLADYFVIMTGYSRVQVRAIAQSIEAQVESDWQRRPLQTEGKADSSWVLLDYGEVIVHIMMPTEREFYNLEAFWSHAERISLANSDEGGGKPK
ncbi:ribosome silencing factor [Nodularia chucula]|uniref:ribosome silencing factor n=1 Tax=Nodularia chucula TaxID=3093667 RepID=UPI0039C5E418